MQTQRPHGSHSDSAGMPGHPTIREKQGSRGMHYGQTRLSTSHTQYPGSLTPLTAVIQHPERKNTETLLNFLHRALEMVLPGSWTWEGRRALQLHFWLNYAPMH